MKKSFFLPFLVLFSGLLFAEVPPPGSWLEKEAEMRLLLNEAFYTYVSRDIEGACAQVDRVFTEYYRDTGFEQGVLERISEERDQNIDDWFDYIKSSMRQGVSQRDVRGSFNQLTYLLRISAGRLDGKEEPVAEARNWTKTAEEMARILTGAWNKYRAGDAKGARDEVDVVYFQYYEKLGFEKIVMTRLSGERASTVEYQFSAAKKAISRGDDAEVQSSLETLSQYLVEDAAQLDSKVENALGVFIGSLLIILREGFEAIIIVGAIIAYLVKSGNKKNVKHVYWGSVVALAFSAVMAVILNAITSTAGGRNQEIIEGATMLLAVVVLFYVSNWMVSKAEAEAWAHYIEGKVQSSITSGSMFSLAFAAFLAVFREGAETILFYQALLAGNGTYVNMVWLGFGIGAAVLVVVYILIRVLSLALPLKPFFLGTSVLLFVMSVSFVGAGIKEFQEAGVISATMLPFGFTVDILGIYPTLQTLIPQAAFLVITVAVFMFQIRKNKRLSLERAA
ncbi:MAG: FTR1 family iron permease [Spirochaetaceae bacterium]|jgi:high-affinity iron transporter|nr:FTR1 family iron permease [Spirochaetaceae bacterium]